jgi:hypothetical protein
LVYAAVEPTRAAAERTAMDAVIRAMLAFAAEYPDAPRARLPAAESAGGAFTRESSVRRWDASAAVRA